MIKRLMEILESNPDSNISIRLPSEDCVPAHFHITEVGRVQKTFIDCGGTYREIVSCVLQVWTAHDIEHRLLAGKLATILRLAENMLHPESLPVEIEYGNEVMSHYFLKEIENTPNGLVFVLEGKKTECLAPDKCGVNQCCTGTGCC
jgi:hypothetical protein